MTRPNGCPCICCCLQTEPFDHHPGETMANWLDQLEQELDQRLSAFLRSNPVQDALFEQQHLQDRARALQRQRQQLQGEAEQQRKALLKLAGEVRAWRERADRARKADAADLARRAEQHLSGLMDQGRCLWSDLADLGRRFEEVELQLKDLNRQQQTPNPSTLERDWALFEQDQELERLRRKNGQV